MGVIDDMLLGYSYARHRSEVLADCRGQAKDLGEGFLRGLVATADGKDVYFYIQKARGFEMSTRGGCLEKGYVLYQLLHPLRSLQDSADVSDIVMSEVKPA